MSPVTKSGSQALEGAMKQVIPTMLVKVSWVIVQLNIPYPNFSNNLKLVALFTSNIYIMEGTV